MFSLMEKTNHNNHSCYNGAEEISREDMAAAAASLSAINHFSMDTAYDIMNVWMVLFASLSHIKQKEEF